MERKTALLSHFGIVQEKFCSDHVLPTENIGVKDIAQSKYEPVNSIVKSAGPCTVKKNNFT